MRRIGRWVAAGAFVVASVVHLATQVSGDPTWIVATIWLPVLVLALWYLLSVARWDRRAVLTGVGLVVSALGDGVGSIGLSVKLGLFLIAQICYVVAFLPGFRRAEQWRPWWRQLRWVPYVVVVTALVLVLVPRAGVLAPAVIGYGLALGLMAVVATSLGRIGVLGGACFLVSDGLLALQEFGVWTFPGQGFVIMATYLAAQSALAYGVASRSGSAAVA